MNPPGTQPAPVRLPGRARQVLASLTAGVGLVALLVGVPLVLKTVAGFPLPDHLPSWDEVKTALLTRDDGQLFLATLAWLAWATWALLVVTVALEALAQLRGRATPRIPGLGPAQWLARVLITGLTAAVLATSGNPGRASTPPPPMPVAAAPPAPATSTPTPLAEQTETPSVEPAAHSTTDDHPVYVVKPRDTLWGIAERFLGNGERYAGIAHLNYGRPQPDGDTLTNSHWINPGWRLLLPPDATTPTNAGHHWYVVQPGDTLRGIASRELDDPDRYREIARLNHGRIQPDGGRLTDPDEIRPGWRLLLPHATGEHQPPARPDKPPQSRSPQPSQSPSPDAPTSADRDTENSHGHGVIRLPSGAVVGGTLATAIGTAITLIYLHRRRRYRPLSDTPTAPVGPERSPAARQLRRTYLTGLAEDTDEPDHPVDVPHPTPHQTPQPPQRTLTLSSRDRQEVVVAANELGGLGLEGPGAEDAARAVLTAMAAGGHDITEIIIPEPDLRHLLGHDPDDTTPLRVPPTVTITPTLADALLRLETEMMHRTRLLDSYDTTNITAFRRDHPDEEPLPALVLLARNPDRARHRLAAVLALGRRYDIGAVVLGTCPDGTNCHVDHDGQVTHAIGAGSERFTGSELFHLPTADTTDLLAVLSAATGEEPEEDHTPNNQAPAVADPPDVDTSSEAKQVSLTVFGPVRIHVDGKEIATGLRSRAREVLAYLAYHAGGPTIDQILADLWPEDEHSIAATQFHVAITNIRKLLRGATHDDDTDFVIHAGGAYHLDTERIDVDLWRFRHHLHRASTTDTDTTIAKELGDAVDVYQADFTSGRGYEWAQPLAETLHRTAVDACTRMANHHERAGDTEQAVTALDQALSLDPHNEDLYQRTIRLLASLDRTDAVRRLYRQLQNRLADLDVDPDPATERLVSEHLTKNTKKTRADHKHRGP